MCLWRQWDLRYCGIRCEVDLRFDVGLSPQNPSFYVHEGAINTGSLHAQARHTAGCCACDAGRDQFLGLLRPKRRTYRRDDEMSPDDEFGSQQRRHARHRNTQHQEIGSGRLLRFVRLSGWAVRGAKAGAGRHVALSCVQIFTAATPSAPGVPFASLSNPGGNLREGATVDALRNPEGREAWSDQKGAALIVELKEPGDIIGYRFRTAGDGAEHDPVTWRVDGAQSKGGPWDLLHLQLDESAVPGERWCWTHVFDVDGHMGCCTPAPGTQRGLSAWRCAPPQLCYNFLTCACACCIRCIVEKAVDNMLKESFPPPKPTAQLMN